LRLLHIIKHTARLGGNVHAAIDLACGQAAIGHQVIVCRSLGDFDEILNKAGVEIATVDHLRERDTPAAILRFGRFCRNWKPDVIHSHMVSSTLVAWPVAKLLGVPLIATVHNEFQRSAVLSGVADRVIAVSRENGVALLRRGLSQSRVRVVLNGTIGSARHPQPAPDPAPIAHPAIVCVAGQHPRKGIDHLLRAMRIVCDNDERAHLYVVGEGPMLDEYRNLALALGLQDRVTFTGGLDDPRSYMAAADIFVLPSINEPAGIVLTEARQFNCAVVASNVGGIPEMLDHGAAGILVPPGASEPLARAIVDLLQNEARLSTYKRLCRTGLERFSVRRMVNETLGIYLDAIKGRELLSATETN
jgi:glycosyltransferase involved in cell wall biosynthesis